MNKIRWYKKSNFGVIMYYLSKSNGANINEAILGLTGGKTLRYSDIQNLMVLGFEFIEIIPEI